MSSYFGRLSCLLLCLPPAWAAVTLTVPSVPIQATPGSDVQLPCHISELISLNRLAVIWKLGEDVIAKYEDTFTIKRPGALMTVEQLQTGDATLLLPNVQDTDAGVYTCFVILMPDRAEKTVELRVEAPPSLTLGPRKLQLLKPGVVTCKASDFYPGSISVTWFRDGRIVKGPEFPRALLSRSGLFSAESVLELTPQIADDGANISCRVEHTAIRGPLSKEDFELQVQARPILQVHTVPPEKNFGAAKCLVSGFYPKDIQVQWLRNGVPHLKVESHPQRMPDGTFSMQSVLFPEESNVEVIYVCQVQHEALDAPLEQTILWQPKGEGDGITSPTPLYIQSTGKELTSQSPRLKAISTSPSDLSPAPGILESPATSSIDWKMMLLVGLAIGLLLGAVAGILIYRKVKHKPAPGTKSKQVPIEDEDHTMLKAATENPNDTCVAKL